MTFAPFSNLFRAKRIFFRIKEQDTFRFRSAHDSITINFSSVFQAPFKKKKKNVYKIRPTFTGPFVREGASPSPSPLLHRATPNVRAVTRSNDTVDGATNRSTPPTSPQLGKVIIRAARSPERAASPDYVRTPTTVVGPTSPTTAHRQVRGAYVNVQEDEGKTKASGTSTDDRHCTGCTAARLDATNPRVNDKSSPPSLIADESPLLSARSGCRPAPDRDLLQPDPNKSKTKPCEKTVEESRSGEKENDDLSPDLAPLLSRKENVANGCATNSRLDLDRSALLRPRNPSEGGATPKLNRKLLVSDLDTPNFSRKTTRLEVGEETRENWSRNGEKSAVDDESGWSSRRGDDRLTIEQPDFGADNASKRLDTFRGRSVDNERKVKRSESYRMANSPIMFIKKFSGNGEKSSKICRTPSEELQEELLKERINYPETISSPEPPLDANVNFDMNVTISIPVANVGKSPRPRPTDIEPARVLKYSGNDTEIW